MRACILQCPEKTCGKLWASMTLTIFRTIVGTHKALKTNPPARKIITRAIHYVPGMGRARVRTISRALVLGNEDEMTLLCPISRCSPKRAMVKGSTIYVTLCTLVRDVTVNDTLRWEIEVTIVARPEFGLLEWTSLL
eukprot:401698-Prymnesium_polylepis.2